MFVFYSKKNPLKSDETSNDYYLHKKKTTTASYKISDDVIGLHNQTGLINLVVFVVCII